MTYPMLLLTGLLPTMDSASANGRQVRPLMTSGTGSWASTTMPVVLTRSWGASREELVLLPGGLGYWRLSFTQYEEPLPLWTVEGPNSNTFCESFWILLYFSDVFRCTLRTETSPFTASCGANVWRKSMHTSAESCSLHLCATKPNIYLSGGLHGGNVMLHTFKFHYRKNYYSTRMNWAR